MALFISQKMKSLATILALVAVVIETFMVGTLFIMTWKPSRKSYKRYINSSNSCRNLNNMWLQSLQVFKVAKYAYILL